MMNPNKRSLLRKRVLVTRMFDKVALRPLMESCDVTFVDEDRPLGRERFLELVRDKEGLLCTISDRVDEETLEAGERLLIVSNVAVGYDNVDVEAATRHGVMVTNTPDVLTESTADLAWTLLLAAARRVVEGDRKIREGMFIHWEFSSLLGYDLNGRVLGIVGLGRIGQAVARRAMGFGMEVIYTSRNRVHPSVEEELRVRFVDKETLLCTSDFISLHVPLNSSTRHYISERELSMMKRTCVLVNTARGPVVDERALVKALKEGRIAAAGLDVYEDEPRLAPGLTELPNVVLTPHIGSATHETRYRMTEMAVRNCLAGLAGSRPPNLVNPELLDSKKVSGGPLAWGRGD